MEYAVRTGGRALAIRRRSLRGFAQVLRCWEESQHASSVWMSHVSGRPGENISVLFSIFSSSLFLHSLMQGAGASSTVGGRICNTGPVRPWHLDHTIQAKSSTWVSSFFPPTTPLKVSQSISLFCPNSKMTTTSFPFLIDHDEANHRTFIRSWSATCQYTLSENYLALLPIIWFCRQLLTFHTA